MVAQKKREDSCKWQYFIISFNCWSYCYFFEQTVSHFGVARSAGECGAFNIMITNNNNSELGKMLHNL